MATGNTTQFRSQELTSAADELEIYDFATLRDELGLENDNEDHAQDLDSNQYIIEEEEYENNDFFEETDEVIEFDFAQEIEKVQPSNFEEEAFGVRRPVEPIKGKGKAAVQPSLFTKNPLAKKQITNNKGNKNVNINAYQPAPIVNEITPGISFAAALNGIKKNKTNKTNQEQQKADEHNEIEVEAIKERKTEPQPSSLPPPSNDIMQLIQKQSDEPVQHDDVKLSSSATTSNPKTLEEIESQLRPSHQNNHNQPNPLVQTNTNAANSGNNLLHILLPGLSSNSQQTEQVPVAHPQSSVPFDINTFFRNHQQQEIIMHQQSHFHSHPNISTINRDLVQKPNLTLEQELKQDKEDSANDVSPEHSTNDINHDTTEHKRVLKIVDELYSLLLELEQIHRNRDQMEQSKFSTLVTEKVDSIWKIFNVEDSSNVVSILSVSKGQMLISRVLPYISDYQQNGLMTVIASHIADLPFRPSELEVNKKDLVDYKEKLELRLSFLMRHVSAFLIQSSLAYIIDALSYTANHSNFNCLIASMSGQGYLGNLLSNGLSKAENQQMNEEESKKYRLAIDQIFNKFMDNVPLLVTMATIENTSLWILLNSLATSCNQNQFKKLMNEFRGIILMTLNNIECMKRSYQNISFSAKLTYPILVKLNETISMHEL